MKYCMFCGSMLNEAGQCTCEAFKEKQLSQEMNTPEIESVDTPEEESNLNSDQPVQLESAQTSQTMNHNSNSNPIQTDFINSHRNIPPKKHHSVIGTALRNVFPFIKALWNTPTTAIKACASNTDFPLALIFYLVYIVTLGLFSGSMALKLTNTIDKLCSIVGVSGSKIASVSIPWTMVCFLVIGLFEVVIVNLFVCILKCILHGPYNCKQLICGNCAIFVFPLLLNSLMALFALISFPITVSTLFFIKCITMLIMIYHVLKTLFHRNDNSSFIFGSICMITLLYFLITISTLRLFVSFIPKIFSINNFSSNRNNQQEHYDDYFDFDDWNDYFDYFN